MLSVLSVCPAAFAAEPAEELRTISSARAVGMGNAYRALGQGTEALQGNPAAMALFPAYRVEATGSWDTHTKDGYLGIGLMDSSTSKLALGVDYHWVSLRGAGSRASAHLSSLGAAVPLTQGVMVGVIGRYLRLSGQDRYANSTTLDVGALLRLSEAIVVGFSAHNLIDTHNAELTRYYSGHLGILAGTVTAAFDVRGDFTTRESSVFTYNGGLEYVLDQVVPLRVGYTYDGFSRSSKLGLGLGFMSPGGGGIDLGYQHEFGGAKGRLLILTFRLNVGGGGG
ncbi:hypothetical protein JGU66_09510 [Myxococcaceae bacterium JPH2]|nr:hypothetical protein [Myxococcaceae bacterium JPH2]